MDHPFRSTLCLLIALVAAAPSLADDVTYTHKEDLIYARKFGTALTLDVFIPNENSKHLGLIVVASGAWVSTHDWVETLRRGVGQAFLNRGYTICLVFHGCSPRFTIPEIQEDLHRSVRFIRSRAEEFQIDPARIGIMGFSSGGQLALMQGMAGDDGDPNAKDPIDRLSSRVQAVCCGAPPTDFLNYGAPGENALGVGKLAGFRAAFDFQEFDKKANAYVRVTDEQKRLDIGKQISPVYHVTADDPPTFIIHGDKDSAVPIQQSELLISKLREAGVPAELRVRQGANHLWSDPDKDWPLQADWFDKYLLKK